MQPLCLPLTQWNTLKSINQLKVKQLVLFENRRFGYVHFLIPDYCTVLLEGSTYPIVLTENKHDIAKLKVLYLGDGCCCIPTPERAT